MELTAVDLAALRQIAMVASYDELIDAFRTRAAEIAISYSSIDDRAGLARWEKRRIKRKARATITSPFGEAPGSPLVTMSK